MSETPGQRLRAYVRRHLHTRQNAQKSWELSSPPRASEDPVLILSANFASGLNADTGQVASATSGVWAVTGGQAYVNETSSAVRKSVVWDVGRANVEIEATMVFDNAMNMELTVRQSDNNNYLFGGVERSTQNRFFLGKYEAGAFSSLGTTAVDSAVTGQTYRVKIRAVTDTIELFIDGAKRLTATSALNQTVTNHGLGAFRNAPDGTYPGRWDNLTIRAIKL